MKNRFGLSTFNLDLHTLGLTLFISFSAVFLIFRSPDFTANLYEGTVSAATLNNYSISARIQLYYGGIGIFLLSLLCCVFFFKNIQDRIKKKTSFRWLGVLSYVGVLLLLGALTGVDTQLSFKLLFSLAFLPLLDFLFGFFSQQFDHVDSVHYKLALVFGLAVSFIPLIFLSITNQNKAIDFFTVWNCASLLFFLFLTRVREIERWAYRLRSVIYIPVVYALSIECFLIFNQRHWTLLSFSLLVVLGMAILLYFVVKDMKRSSTLILHNQSADFLKKRAYPLLLVVLAWQAYQSLYIYQDTEMFETANQANGIMRMFVHGELPFVDFYGSHLLYDLYQGIIYTLFNGYDNVGSYATYFFTDQLIYLLLVYFFLVKLLKHAEYALLLLLFLPFHESLFSHSYVLVFLLLFAIYRLYEKGQEKRSYWLVVLSGLLVCLWKMDFLVAGGGSALFTLLLVSNQRFSWVRLLRVVGLVLIGFVGILFILAWFKQVDLLGNLTQLYHYFSGAQNHGLLDVATVHDRYFYGHFIIFPLLICLLGVYHVYRIKKSALLAQHTFASIALLFFILFYLLNAQRGLVRHSFIEGTDSYISAFLYLILALAAYLYLFQNKPRKLALLYFSLTLIGSHWLLSFQDPVGQQNPREKLISGVTRSKGIPNTKLALKRVESDVLFMHTEIKPIKRFLDKHFPASSSFIDFSNTPMLYYYTERKIPSLFSQSLQNSHDEYLQAKQIIGFAKYDLPIVLFRHAKDGVFWDATDGVPNALRYFLITNYLYKHYEPFTILGGHCAWLRKETNIPDFGYIQDTISTKKMEIPLGALAHLWEPRFVAWSKASRTLHTDEILETDSSFLISATGDASLLNLTPRNTDGIQTITLSLLNESNEPIGSFSLWLDPSKKAYAIPSFIHYLCSFQAFKISVPKAAVYQVSSKSFTFNLQQVLDEYR